MPRSGPTDCRVWLVGTGVSATRVAEALARAEVEVVTAPMPEVGASTRSGDLVFLAGLAPEDAVATTEDLLGQGLSVALDVSDRPILKRALGQCCLGVDCALLAPGGPSTVGRWCLRLRDVVVAGAALLILLPALALLAVLVKATSPGPVFYATNVIGRHGRPFRWRKFRTMRVGTPEDDERRREAYRALVTAPNPLPGRELRSTKIVDGGRVTALGRILRRHSLDELPQLWNVLLGEMTLVGPRPCLPYEYELQQPWHRRRYRVTPGLSGAWQAYGRSRVGVDEMALLDYCYGRSRSFWLDLRIIVRTVAVVVTGEGGR